jgi:hypothetical protein
MVRKQKCAILDHRICYLLKRLIEIAEGCLAMHLRFFKAAAGSLRRLQGRVCPQREPC